MWSFKEVLINIKGIFSTFHIHFVGWMHQDSAELILLLELKLKGSSSNLM